MGVMGVVAWQIDQLINEALALVFGFGFCTIEFLSFALTSGR